MTGSEAFLYDAWGSARSAEEIRHTLLCRNFPWPYYLFYTNIFYREDLKKLESTLSEEDKYPVKMLNKINVSTGKCFCNLDLLGAAGLDDCVRGHEQGRFS